MAKRKKTKRIKKLPIDPMPTMLETLLKEKAQEFPAGKVKF